MSSANRVTIALSFPCVNISDERFSVPMALQWADGVCKGLSLTAQCSLKDKWVCRYVHAQ
jgi:hypothetical protein